jgi:hypothetical protein
MDFFHHHLQDTIEAEAPLAARMRPRTLDEFMGQDAIVGPGRLLRRAIQADQLSSPLAMALTETLLGAFAITANPQTTALPDKLLGGFGLTDPAEERVQGLDAELANGRVQRRQVASNTHR